MLEIYECSWSNNKTIERHHKFNWQWHVILCTANIWLIVISPYAQVHPYLYSLSHLSVKICSCSTWHGKLKYPTVFQFTSFPYMLHRPTIYLKSLTKITKIKCLEDFIWNHIGQWINMQTQKVYGPIVS